MEYEPETSCSSLGEACSASNISTSNDMLVSTFNIVLTTVWVCYWLLLRLIIFIVVLNIIPLLVLGFLYLSSFYCHLYKYWNTTKTGEKSELYATSIYERARDNIVWGWDLIGKIWFGYEIQGLENLPEGGAILAYYHGTIPIDIYFIISKIRIECKRSLHTVADRFVYKLHGLKLLWRIFSVNTGIREDCIQLLKDGNLLAIAPGGTREAYFSDNTYPLLWNKRKGFASVAKEANVPIVPVFTKNCREAFRTPKFGRSILRWLYEKSRGPIVPIYGGFPVKLKTFIGQPIHWDPQMSVEDMVQKAREAIEDLIQTHQQTPGSIRRAFMERFATKEKAE